MKDIRYSKIKENLYAIEQDGRVWSYSAKKYMKLKEDKDGYFALSLKNNNGGYSKFGVHRLLMIAFNPIENMENMQINHKDGNKKNNSLENLEWVTCQENLAHARKTGLNKTFGQIGINHPNNKITEEEAKKIISLFNQGKTPSEILKQVPNATRSIVNSITHNRTWKHLPR